MKKNIYLTRHGESTYNLENRLGGNPYLSKKGYKYAKSLTKYINNLDEKIIVFTSQLIRTINTVKDVKFKKMKYIFLNEINAGICENMTYDEVKQKYPHEFEKRKKDKLNYKYIEGESYKDLIKRINPIFDIINKSNNSVLIVAHQAVLRVIYGKILKITEEKYPYISIPLHTLITINIDDCIENYNLIKVNNKVLI